MRIITATSNEMKKNAKIVGSATGGFAFKGGYDKVNWKLVRLMCNFGYTFMPKEKDVRFSKIDLGGISGIIATPKKMESEDLILYIHGGGLVSGSAKATKGYCSMLAKHSGCRVISIDYRLCPENPYPAGIDDCETAYLALRKTFPNSKVCVTGESAGGFLTLTLTVRLLSKGEQLPECLLPQSPLCDLTGELDRSYYTIRDNTVTPEGLDPLFDMYAPGVDRKDPEISVSYCDRLGEFPPTLMSCDSNETLRADAEDLEKKMRTAGACCDLIMLENSFHACSTLGTGSPETLELMQEDISFMKACFRGERPSVG
ncbi:MAG: alpha/beta hydrolase fold domain-containing protein [Oscillospiraceae bacterium]|nr:alpha/beta hydrolase fold domain-containing protein [Oscillospiraceae bacterium]